MVLSGFAYLVMYKTSVNVYSLSIDKAKNKYSPIKLLNLKIDCFLNIHSSGLIKSNLVTSLRKSDAYFAINISSF